MDGKRNTKEEEVLLTGVLNLSFPLWNFLLRSQDRDGCWWLLGVGPRLVSSVFFPHVGGAAFASALLARPHVGVNNGWKLTAWVFLCQHKVIASCPVVTLMSGNCGHSLPFLFLFFIFAQSSLCIKKFCLLNNGCRLSTPCTVKTLLTTYGVQWKPQKSFQLLWFCCSFCCKEDKPRAGSCCYTVYGFTVFCLCEKRSPVEVQLVTLLISTNLEVGRKRGNICKERS